MRYERTPRAPDRHCADRPSRVLHDSRPGGRGAPHRECGPGPWDRSNSPKDASQRCRECGCTCWSALIALATLAEFVSDSLLLRILTLLVIVSQFLALIYVTLWPEKR